MVPPMQRLTLIHELRGSFTEVGPGLFDVSLKSCDGGDATLVTQLSFAADERFSEDGRIELGDGQLCFRTLVDGHMSPTADPALWIGTAVREISSGSGALAGASGRITSMFVADGEGQVRDRELALVFLPERSTR
jgi:hypothetical protein